MHQPALLGITHKLIRPRTPWHNGKVERRPAMIQKKLLLTGLLLLSMLLSLNAAYAQGRKWIQIAADIP